MGLYGLAARFYKTYAMGGTFFHCVVFIDGKKAVSGRCRRGNLLWDVGLSGGEEAAGRRQALAV
jgi:hypothetical protein